MKIRKMTKYAMQVIGFLYTKDKVATARTIGEQEKIPHGALMKVLHALASEDIVTSHQGRGSICGGFSLNKSLTEVTMHDLMRIMGEEICQPSQEDPQDSIETRMFLGELERVQSELELELKRYTLEDIINRERDRVTL